MNIRKLVRKIKTTIPLIALVTAIGCTGEYSGGGAMDSSSGVPGEKATFGFNVYLANDGISCDEVVSARGQFQYVDHGANVAFHAKINDFGFVNDEDFNVFLVFVGKYYIKGKERGTVLIRVEDHGQESKTDFLWLAVLDGPYEGYNNSGTFAKGNVTYTPDALCQED